MRDLVFILIFGSFLPICFFRPFLGILVWTVMSYLSPERYAFGFTRFLPVGYMTAIPTIAGMFVWRKFHFPPVTRETCLLGLLWLWFAITTINVYYSALLVHHFAETVTRFGDISRVLLMVFTALMLIRTKNQMRWWCLITAGCFAFLALKATRFGFATSGEFRAYGPPNTELADNNAFGLALDMSIPMFLYLGKIDSSRTVRIGCFISFFAALVGVVLSYSRGAFVGLFFLMLAIAMQSKYKVRAVAGLIVITVILSVAAPKPWIERMETLKTAHKTDASAQERFNS